MCGEGLTLVRCSCSPYSAGVRAGGIPSASSPLTRRRREESGRVAQAPPYLADLAGRVRKVDRVWSKVLGWPCVCDEFIEGGREDGESGDVRRLRRGCVVDATGQSDVDATECGRLEPCCGAAGDDEADPGSVAHGPGPTNSRAAEQGYIHSCMSFIPQ